MPLFRHVPALCLLLSGLLLASGNVLADSLDLPDIGDSSATALSPEQERRIGKQYLRQLRRGGVVNNDPILTEYIADLGQSLAAASGQPADSFTFFVVDDPTINAFAMPGGYIGVHTGLIRASRSEGELASVLAHEMAHVTQRHLARSYKKASDMNLPMTAAVIAAILLGGSNPELASAAIASTQAASAQMQLNFTRDNEREADRVGMEVLASSGFDPRSMPDFFQRLHEESRYAGGNIPEFLLTHPVTESRIADSLNRAEQYPQSKPKDAINYSMLKARLVVQESSDKEKLLKQIEQQLETGQYENRESARFTYALALQASGKAEQAIGELKSLLEQHPNRIIYIHTLGQALRERHPQEAQKYYQKGLKLYPNNTLLTLGSVEVLHDLKSYEKARELLYQFIRAHSENPRAYQLLAETETRLGNKPASRLAQAEYYYLNFETRRAIEQLQLARQDKPIDFYYASRIDALLDRLKQELETEKAE